MRGLIVLLLATLFGVLVPACGAGSYECGDRTAARFLELPLPLSSGKRASCPDACKATYEDRGEVVACEELDLTDGGIDPDGKQKFYCEYERAPGGCGRD